MIQSIKSTVIAVGMVFTASTASAYSNDVTCNADFAYDIEIKGDKLTFSSEDQQKVLITSNDSLYLDGEKQILSPQQLTLLQQYNEQVRDLLPAASGVAEEASAIAIEAVGMITAALMQDQPEKAEEFMAKVETISSDLRKHISQNHFRPKGLESYLESSDFEAEFEALIETAVTDFVEGHVGEMIVAAMSGNEEKVKAFEQRMEAFGKEMEATMEARAEKLEQQAEELCMLVQKVDQKEADLVKAFDKFDSYQLITD
ncbi:DUF2884 family protein [Kangiella sediminilitoris]|uniref:DUF2884 family protein n=1 Tax=Kangiella sediminilitoris TaxID=1144748 RepID=A0A1B3BAW8_9GAMM|nr:DUF2884 family protein [Kangiella sediminilitoris]AOE49942.1 hypothetical protein KS2013_1223 [Kangiella sediminilitoris]